MTIDIDKIKKEKPIEELIEFGILNVDKPADWTSFDVVNHIRGMLKLDKCGHFGTLDPMVTGVLPICLGNACRIQEYFMHHEKVYIGEMKMHKPITREELEAGMKKFLGKINQLPPRKSRVKRVVRQREVMKFEITSFNSKTMTAEFIAHVEAGTYIRKLISDLGDNLGIGGQMTSLRRLKAGLFSSEDKEFAKVEEIDKAIKEFELGDEKALRKLIVPAEIIAKLLPCVEIKEEYIQKLYNGSPLFKEMLQNKDSALKVIEAKMPFAVISCNKLIEIAKFSDKFENKEILAKPEAVLKR